MVVVIFRGRLPRIDRPGKARWALLTFAGGSSFGWQVPGFENGRRRGRGDDEHSESGYRPPVSSEECLL